jgi:hypothetical protein
MKKGCKGPHAIIDPSEKSSRHGLDPRIKGAAPSNLQYEVVKALKYAPRS